MCFSLPHPIFAPRSKRGLFRAGPRKQVWDGSRSDWINWVLNGMLYHFKVSWLLVRPILAFLCASYHRYFFSPSQNLDHLSPETLERDTFPASLHAIWTLSSLKKIYKAKCVRFAATFVHQDHFRPGHLWDLRIILDFVKVRFQNGADYCGQHRMVGGHSCGKAKWPRSIYHTVAWGHNVLLPKILDRVFYCPGNDNNNIRAICG